MCWKSTSCGTAEAIEVGDDQSVTFAADGERFAQTGRCRLRPV